MKTDQSRQKIWEVFRQVLNLKDEDRNKVLNRKILAQWDSLTHLNLLLSLEAHFSCNLIAHSGKLHSFDDVVRAVLRQDISDIASRKLVEICFIGNCHATNLFRDAAQQLKKRRAPYRVVYHHVDHILHYLTRADHLNSKERIQAVERDAEHLASCFRPFVERADIIVYSQIFQMEGSANFPLARAIQKRFGKRFVFVSMPVPFSLRNDSNGPYGQFYTGEHYLEAAVIREQLPEAEVLDTSPGIQAFYERNGSLSFFSRIATDNSFLLDLTHPQPLFWDWFQANYATPLLLEEPSPNLPVPDYKTDLTPRLQAIENQETNGFGLLAETSSPTLFVEEALKQMWRSHPRLRSHILKACLMHQDVDKMAGLFRQVEWCGSSDLTLEPEEAGNLDEALSHASLGFRDNEVIHRAILAIILVYQWSLTRSRQAPKTRAFVDEHLFRLEILFNKRQKFLGHAPATASSEALTCLRSRILCLLDGAETWMLYGAGTLAHYISDALGEGDPKPVGVISGYKREWGTRFRDLPVISPAQARSLEGPVIVATRSMYYTEIFNLLEQNNLKGIPFFEFPNREFDPVHSQTLAQRLKRASFTLTWNNGKGSRTSYSLKQLLYWGQALVEPVLPPRGGVLPVILPTSPAVFAIFYYCLMRGVLPTLLSYPTNRRNPADYRQQIRAVTRNLSASVVVCDASVAHMLEDSCSIHLVDDVHTTFGEEEAPLPELRIDPDERAFLQHSSGTTGIQKTVPITHRQALRQLDAYGRALNIDRKDIIVSWLPLYHDMGLITSLLGPPLWGVDIVACDPVTWVEQPALILEMAHEHKATLAWWPNFTYALLARLPLASYDLSCLRMVVNCSEPVTYEAVNAFGAKAAPSGFPWQAASSCYAMAETTFAVTQSPPHRSVLQLPVNRRYLASGLIKHQPGSDKVLMSSGPLLDISRVTISDENGQALPLGQIGEIYITSASLFDGYLHGEELNTSSLSEMGYASGDLGFLWPAPEGPELFVTGRKKDLIIMAGENYYPDDLERTAETIEGVKSGRSVAFGVFDEQLQTEVLVIAVEESRVLASDEREEVEASICERILQIHGLKVSHAFVYPVRSMIKSSAGKISRKASRQMILETRLQNYHA